MSEQDTEHETDDARRKGPRRSESSRAAILEATRDELTEQGWRRFSVDNVARRAHASKQTIYRWWPATGTMCIEAAFSVIPAAPASAREPLDRITVLLEPIETSVRTGNVRSALRGAILAACDEKEAGEALRAWVKSEIRTPLRIILAELAAKHVIRHDYDLEEAVEMLLGSLWHNILVMRAPLKEGFSKRQAERLLKFLAPVKPA